MKIGELARTTGFKDKTIRYYERQGLLPDPRRTPSGYREYGPEDIHRLEFIRKAKRLGLSLSDIKSVLQVHDRYEPTCRHVRSLLDEKLAQVDGVLRDLQAFREDLVVDEIGFHLAAGRGETVIGGLGFIEPGNYVGYCSVPGHREAGMDLEIVVTPSGDAGGHKPPVQHGS